MRVSNWRAKEVFEGFKEKAFSNAEGVMDEVVVDARARCPVGKFSYKKYLSGMRGEHKYREISFTPKSGRNKGQTVRFSAKVMKGRQPGTLKNTIRRVSRRSNSTIRVIAGNSEVIYARFVEKGTSKMAARPFLRPAFNQKKKSIVKRVAKGGKV